MPPERYVPLAFLRQKVRVRLLDSDTGLPLSGVALSLEAEVSDGDPRLRFPVNTLVSDHVGYAAFSLARFASLTPEMAALRPQASGFDTDRVTALRLQAPGIGVVDLDLLAGLITGHVQGSSTSSLPDLGVIGAYWAAIRGRELGLPEGPKPLVNHFDSAFVVRGSRRKARAGCGCNPANVKGLRSVEDPDDIDREISPGSFFVQDPILVGGESCQVANASSTPPREVRLFQVAIPAASVDDLDALKNAMLSLEATESPASVPRWATVQRFVQRWTALGHSLGDIRYSLPLAPGESVNLAVIEWSRDDTITRSDAAYAQESLDHRQRRNRDIEEAVEATLREDQGGGSFMAGTSAAASATVPVKGVPVTLAGGLAIGGGVTHSWGQRDLAAETAQALSDRLSQVSESLRSLNSTTVIQADQREKSNLASRTVANHNRCHAMTIQYFEVLRNYRVELFALPDLKALLLPFKSIAFDAAAALRWEHLLRPALMQPLLAAGFDALRLQLHGAALLAGGQGSGSGGTGGAVQQGPTPFRGSSQRRIEPKKNLESSNVDITGLFIAEDSLVQVQEDSDSGWISYGIANDHGAGGAGPVPSNERSQWREPDAPRHALVARIGSQTYPVGAGRTFTARQAGLLEFFVNDKDGQYLDNWAIPRGGEPVFPPANYSPVRGLRFTVTVMAPPGPGAGAQAGVVPNTTAGAGTTASPQAKANFEATTLLAHLQAQSAHYNRVVWLGMGAGDLERMLGLASSQGLLDGLDSRPVAVWRNYLAFVAPGSAEGNAAARKLLTRQIVALPSRGTLAEAQLGHCVACEERDASRVQEWTLRPDDRAPTLEQLVPGPQGQAPTVTGASLPSAVLGIQAAPAAPDPSGMAQVLQAITRSNGFRDMSAQKEVNDLLEKLVDGSFASLADAKAAAKKAQQASKAAEAPAAEDEREALAPNGVSAAELANRFSLLPEIQRFASDLGLDADSARQLALNTVQGTRPARTPAPRSALAQGTQQQVLVRVLDAWDRPVEAEVYVTFTDDQQGPQPVLRTSTRQANVSGYGQNGLLPPLAGLGQGLMDLQLQVLDTDYEALQSEVRELFADGVAYQFAASKRFYRVQVRQEHDERRISVGSGETLGNKAATQLAAEGLVGGSLRKVLELSLKLQGQQAWETEISRTQTQTTEYVLRLPSARLAVTVR